jgi:hypothetical protein
MCIITKIGASKNIDETSIIKVNQEGFSASCGKITAMGERTADLAIFIHIHSKTVRCPYLTMVVYGHFNNTNLSH